MVDVSYVVAPSGAIYVDESDNRQFVGIHVDFQVAMKIPGVAVQHRALLDPLGAGRVEGDVADDLDVHGADSNGSGSSDECVDRIRAGLLAGADGEVE